ncbi:MAG TPA: PEP-CTERM sorting domain-containing protein [Bryobacteraceae bacterium]|jgi:hypothetical protein|nr:PEP-CTERM sorting domain-containing protein [Bryobacteraceae bacterium]
MKNTFSVLAIAALAAVVPAHADIVSFNFTGTVYQTQGSPGPVVGNTVTGHFDLTSTGTFLDYTIAGKSVAPGFTSSATIGPALTDAIYMAQVSPVSSGMPNSTFSLDLSSLTNWPSADTFFTLLSDKTQLPSNLDTINNPLSMFPSTFKYYTANANGTNVVSLSADLTSFTAQAVPEPASLVLITPLLLGLAFFVRRRA